MELSATGGSLSIIEPAPGQLRVLAPQRYLYHWDGNEWSDEGQVGGSPSALRLYLLSEGTLLSVTGRALQFEGHPAVPYADYPFPATLHGFANDAQGQLWGKAGSESILNMSSDEVLAVDGTGGSPLGFSQYAFAPNGSFWCIFGNSAYHQSSGQWTSYDDSNSSLPGTFGWHLAPGQQGDEAWMATYEAGLYRFAGGQWQAQNHPAFYQSYVADVASIPGGAAVVLIDAGVSTTAIWDGLSLTELAEGDQGFKDVPVSDLYYAPETGRLWALGYSSLQYLEDGEWQSPFTALPSVPRQA